jgi:hypothetical protein
VCKEGIFKIYRKKTLPKLRNTQHLYICTDYTVFGDIMPTITLAVPKELKKEMDGVAEINWSEVARTAIKNKLNQLKLLKEITEKSTFTEKDALELGRKINKSLHQRYTT